MLTLPNPILDALQKRFEEALQTTGTVPMNATTLGEVGGEIIALFIKELAVSAVVAGTSPTITPDPALDTLTVAGTCVGILLGMTGPALSAVFTTVGQTLHIVLTIRTPPDWKVATSFPLLGRTLLNNLAFGPQNPPAFLLCSRDGSAAASGQALKVGLNLTLELALSSSSPVSRLQALLPTIANPLPLVGLVSIAAEVESLVLSGSGPNFSLSLPYFPPLPFGSVMPTLDCRSLLIEELDRQIDTLALQARGNVGVGGVDLPLMVNVPLGLNPWNISLIPDQKVSFGQASALFSSLPILDIVPSAVGNLSALLLEEFVVSLSADRTSFSYLSLSVESTPNDNLSWVIVPGVLALTQIGLQLFVNHYGQGKLKASGSLLGGIALGSGLSLAIEVPLPIGTESWMLVAYPELDLPDLGTLAGLLGGASLVDMLPSGLGSIGGFTLASIQIIMDPASLTFSSLALRLVSTQPWTIIPGQLVLRTIDISLNILTPLSNPQLMGHIDSTVALGEVKVQVMVQHPAPTDSWYLRVAAQNVELPSLEDLTQLAGVSLGGLLPTSLTELHPILYDISLEVDLSARELQVFDVVAGTPEDWQWKIIDPYLILDEVGFGLTLDWRSGSRFTSGFLNGQIEIAGLALGLSAKYPGTGGWIFSGGMLPGEVLNLTDVVRHFLPSLPPQVPDITLANVGFTFNTADSSYMFQAETGQPWAVQLTNDFGFSISAAVQIERATSASGEAEYSGFIEGTLDSYFSTDSLGLMVRYAFQPESETYTFVLTFNDFALTANLIAEEQKDTLLTVQLGDLSLGAIVTYLVHLVDPTLHFELTSPWDILNSLNFRDLTLQINITQKSVGIVYALNQDLGLIDIETIGLTYLQHNGSSIVDIFFTGTFFGQHYEENNPLSWDMLNDPPPTPPGKGEKLLDLRYLGMGQRLALVDANADTMALVLANLHQTVLDIGEGEAPWTLLRFNRANNWLIGAELTILDFLSLGGVFNDPSLYGLRLALAGARAGKLSGLEFEILYRKISDTLGVYHIELTLPESVRHLEFGAVSVTLPVVEVDIYTDGSFRVNLGFPVEGDFTNSFAMQAFPFIGFGGFYLALLPGSVSTRVPHITNGTFNPAVEFGLALTIGMGKRFSAGPLKADLSVAVAGVLEGVLSWFNPASSAEPPELYYWVQGTIAIVGKLYGMVDFGIIKASVEMVAYASATLTIEAYQAILIELSVGVTVTASLTILAITLHFSFSLQVDASFVIGATSTPPWNLLTSSERARANYLRTSLLARQRLVRALYSARLHAQYQERLADTGLIWRPVPVLSQAPVATPLNLLPVFTVAGEGNPQVQIAMALFAPNSIPPEARSADEVRQLAGNAPGAATFDLLVQAFLSWAIYARLGRLNENITVSDLDMIWEDLNTNARETGFVYGVLNEFLRDNFRFVFNPFRSDAPPAGSATIVPMPPAFTMNVPGRPPVDFAANPVGSNYEELLAAYFSQLQTNYDYDQAKDPLAPPPTAGRALPQGNESLATLIFRDYFLMLTRGAVQACLDLFNSYPYPITASSASSLALIARQFSDPMVYRVQAGDTLFSLSADFDVEPTVIMTANSGVDFSRPLVPETTLLIPLRTVPATYYSFPGDTLATLSAAWGISTQAIVAANPGVDFTGLAAGTVLTMPVSTLLFALAEANIDRPILRPDLMLILQAIPYQVRDGGDTLARIALRYPGFVSTELAIWNATARGIFLPGATLRIALPNESFFPYTVRAEDTLDLIAAFVFARNGGAVTASRLAWFSATILLLNKHIDFGNPLPVGVTLDVPNAVLTEQGIAPRLPNFTYTTRSADTLELIASYFLLAEIETASLEQLKREIQQINPIITPGSTIKIPAQTYPLSSTATLSSVSALFGISVQDLATVNASTAPLKAQATLVLPRLLHTIAAGDTLASLAETFNLSHEALVGRIAHVPQLFAQTEASGQTVTVPQIRQIAVTDLLATFTRQGEANNLASMVSRFLLHGLQLPDPTSELFRSFTPQAVAAGLANATDFSALYALTGQQFPASDPSGNLLIRFFNTGAAEWLVFLQLYLSFSGDTLAILAARFNTTQDLIQRLNPGVDWANLQQGTLLNMPIQVGDLLLSSSLMQRYFPSVSFDPLVISGPQPLPLGQPTPVRFTLPRHASWQSAVAPLFAETPPERQVVGMPGLWFFPDTLLSQTRAASGEHPYELVSGRGGALSLQVTPLTSYNWATMLPFTLSQVVGESTASQIPGTYLMRGVDLQSRELLVDLFTYLQQGNDRAQLFLLYSADPTSQQPDGYLSDALDATGTLILKTNLSTLTQSGPLLAGEEPDQALPPSGAYYATLADGAAFLQSLWEGSITGSGGYYLRYIATGQADQGLPVSIFANGNEARLWLVVILNSQSALQRPNRRLYRFNNCAVVQDTIDAQVTNVFAQASDGSQQTLVATVPPGNLGLEIERRNPGFLPDSAAQRTASLFSLFAYTLPAASNPFFASDVVVLPTGPVQALPAAMGGTPVPQGVSVDDTVWHFQQLVPLYRFAKQKAVPLSPALPDPARNPYQGLVPRAYVTLAPHFRDVCGNVIAATPTLPNVTVGVGYHDSLIGLEKWPGARGSYLFRQTDGTPHLAISLSLDLARYVPDVANPFAAAVRSAAAHLLKYQQIYYQARQSDVQFSLRTALDQPGQGPFTDPALKLALANFVTSATVYLNAAQSVEAITYQVVNQNTNLGGIAREYAVSLDALARNNADLDANSLFSVSPVLPRYHLSQAGDTLLRVATDAGLTVLQLLQQNQSVLLNPGVILKTSTDDTGSRSYRTRPGDNLVHIVDQEHATIAGLARANSKVSDILNPDKVVTVRGVTLSIGQTDTLVNLVIRFQEQHISTSVEEIAQANQKLPDLFRQDVTLLIPDYVVQPNDTLASICATYSQLSLEILATYNQQDPQNIFPAGTPLYLSTAPLSPTPGQSLAAFAQAYHLTIEQLVAANSTTPLTNGTRIAIPGLVTLAPAGTARYAAYQATGNDTLATIARNLGAQLPSLANINALMPDLFKPGVDIHFPGRLLTTRAGDTFTTLAARADVSISTFVNDPSVNAHTGLVAQQALFVLDLPTVGQRTLGDLAGAYAVALDDLALANSAVAGFLHPNVLFTYENKSIVTTANDTLQSLVYRFADEQQVTTSVQALAQANQDLSSALLATAHFLLPPQRLSLALPLARPFIPAPIFPLTVSLAMTRAPEMIDPEFAGVEYVQRNETLLAPLTDKDQDNSLSLYRFAQSFEQAFAALRLKVATGTETADRVSGQPVRVVHFGSGGLSKFIVRGDRSLFYALAPLSTELQSRPHVATRPYDPETGLLGEAEPQNFQAVDLDAWLKQFLQAVDLFLSPQYAIPAFQLAPDGVQQVIAAKETIAAYLKQRVQPILTQPAPQPLPEQLAAAQEALYQSMLVQLSGALETSALVQIPIETQSPYSRQYRTNAADNLTQVATFYYVSVSYLAQILDQVPGLLNTGLTVTNNGQPYQIAAEDTLLSLARHYNVSVQDLARTIQVPAGKGLFASGVSIPLSTLTKTPTLVDTFTTLAAYFRTDPGLIALANADFPDTLRPEQSITLGNTTHVVKAGDTLTGIAAVFRLDPAAFAENPAIVQRANLLNPSTPFSCSPGKGQSAPRLSGKPVLEVYVTGQADAFPALLAYYQVSQDRLLLAVQGMQRILNTGVTVTYNGRPYQMTATDTLLSVARFFGISVAELVDHVQLPEHQGLFAPNTSINLSRIRTYPLPSDTFQTLAAFFNTTIEMVALANQDLPDLLLAYQTITINARSYTIQPGDKLRQVSAFFGLTVSGLATNPVVALRKGLLNPQTTFYGLQVLPEHTLSTAKGALTNGGSLLTFLFKMPESADFRNLFLHLNYVVNEMEYAIGNVPEVQNYQSSDWLTFVIPIASPNDTSGVNGAIGQVNIPIPLNAYPTPPSLLTQSATASRPDAITLPDLKEWDLAFSYEHQDAAQDTSYILATFNEVFARKEEADDDPFAALAQFAQVYPALKETLSQLVFWPAGQPSPLLHNASMTFATLVRGLASIWQHARVTTQPALSVAPAARTINLFRMNYTYTPTQIRYLESLTLTVLQPANPAQAHWPAIEVYLPEEKGRWARLHADAPLGAERVYHFTDLTIEAFTPLTLRYTFANNDVVIQQNARGGIYLTRNEDLIRRAPTNEVFVHRSPLVRFNDGVVPLLQTTKVIPLSQGTSFAQAVQNFLGQLLNLSRPDDPLNGSYLFRFTVLYGHTLLPGQSGGSPLVSYSPVVFLPRLILSQSYTLSQFVFELEKMVTDWERASNPSKTPGDTYVLQTVLYSNLSDQTNRPVLRLSLPTYTMLFSET